MECRALIARGSSCLRSRSIRGGRAAAAERLSHDARQTVLRIALPTPGQSTGDRAASVLLVALAADVRRAANSRDRDRLILPPRSRGWKRRHRPARDSSGSSFGSGLQARPAADGLQRGWLGNTGDTALVAFSRPGGAREAAGKGEGEGEGKGGGAVPVRRTRRVGGRHRGHRFPLPGWPLAPAVRRPARSEPLVFDAQRHVVQ